MKKCMEYRVESRRPVGRPRKTWLESVEADMAELEIDKPYRKTDYKPIIYIRYTMSTVLFPLLNNCMTSSKTINKTERQEHLLVWRFPSIL